MDLQILTSAKGTKVVTASNLYLVLQLPHAQYLKTTKKWLNDVYEFKDGIRKPEKLKDYALRKQDVSILQDFYLSIELAKMITLTSQSKQKQKYAKWLLSLEDKVEHAELLTKDQILTVLELAKVMGSMSCQNTVEQQHYQKYETTKGKVYDWWKYRSKLIGYTTEKLRNKMAALGKHHKGKSTDQMLMALDKYEMVRTAVIDLFMSRGKSERFAKNLGDLAKEFAKELKVEIWDDRKAQNAFTNTLNGELVNEIKSFKKGTYLSLW